jgi:hypothetical protein
MGNGAADSAAGSILSMFDFSHRHRSGPPNSALFLSAKTGDVRR